jgi:sugar/nucleoside kinase (ribokinase family)
VGLQSAQFPPVADLNAVPRGVDVVLFGENSLDFVARTAAGPAAIAGKRTLTGFDVLPGGQAATAAVGCARQGMRTLYIGLFGGDAWADRVEEALVHEAVDVMALRIPEAPNRLAVVMVDPSGDRIVYEYRDARLRCRDEEEVTAAVVRARIAVVDGTDLAVSTAIARAARAAGVLTIVDVDRVEAGTGDLLSAIDLLVVPEEFVATYSGAAGLGAGLRVLADECKPIAVIATCGANGSLAWVGGREIVTPGYPVPVVDTTGAGDAFRAGLCRAWLNRASGRDGFSEFEALLRWANATAALNCRALGAQAGLPTAEEVSTLVTGGGPRRSK